MWYFNKSFAIYIFIGFTSATWAHVCNSDKLQSVLHEIYNVPANQWDLSNVTLSLSLWYEPSTSVSFTGQKKHICTYPISATWEAQTRTSVKNLDLNFSYTGKTEASFQPWFGDSSMSFIGQPEILIQTTSESQGHSFILPLVWKKGV